MVKQIYSREEEYANRLSIIKNATKHTAPANDASTFRGTVKCLNSSALVVLRVHDAYNLYIVLLIFKESAADLEVGLCWIYEQYRLL